jgi:hypothetical protein
MTWQQKLQLTRKALQENPRLAIAFSEGGRGAPESFLHELMQKYPFLSPDYVAFLRVADGLQIDTCALFGSGATPFTSIPKATKRWQTTMHLTQFLPIGEDASGRCFALNREGEVWRFDKDPTAPHNPRQLAASFSDFLDNVLMGDRFVDLFDGYWQNRKDNEWTQHLRQKGWL